MNEYKVQLFLMMMLPLLCSCGRQGGRVKTLINEVLVANDSNFQDDYGNRNAWIEIFNRSYGSVDIAGYRLKVSSRPGDTITYNVPKGDVLTVIKPRQHALFWADGQPARGTFHTSCVLDTLSNNWVGLYDGGNKLIDQAMVPVIARNCSFARVQDGADEWEVKGDDENRYVTPSTNNKTIDQNAKVEKFKESDPNGSGMSITAMLVVFSGLLALFICFRCIGKVSIGIGRRIIEKSQHAQIVEKLKMKKLEAEKKLLHKDVEAIDEAVYAAIAMALYEEEGGEHDEEQHVLTIHRTHSAWSGI